jgi:hypothetical protein
MLLAGSVLAHPNIVHKNTHANIQSFVPPRSVAVTVMNRTAKLWTLDNNVSGVSSGHWVNPPQTFLYPYNSIFFSTASSTRFSGTSGVAHYTSGTANFSIDWYNPYAGSNAFDVGADSGLIITHSNISGNHSNVTVWICPPSGIC